MYVLCTSTNLDYISFTVGLTRTFLSFGIYPPGRGAPPGPGISECGALGHCAVQRCAARAAAAEIEGATPARLFIFPERPVLHRSHELLAAYASCALVR